MNFDGASVKAPPASRRKIMPSTQQQRTQPPGTPLQMEVEDQEFGACGKEYEGEYRRTAREKTLVAKVEQYLNESGNVKVEIEEHKLEPEDSEVDLRFMVMNARRTKWS